MNREISGLKVDQFKVCHILSLLKETSTVSQHPIVIPYYPIEEVEIF